MNAPAGARTPELRGEIREREPLSKHTVWGIGGPARRFYAPADIDDLSACLASLPESEPIFWLGLGSNLLVRDGGIDATVIFTGSGLSVIERTGETRVRAYAGAACPKVARRCARFGLAGAEFLAGIPGTIGGALAMNAGAFGGETWDIVVGVSSVNRRGEFHDRAPAEFRTGYRSVEGPEDEWFVAAEFELEPDDSVAVKDRIKALLKRRGDTQPMGYRSCGSVFRNPPGDYAARLIEASGLKGHRIGDAAVSEKHANFILNLGSATAADVEALIAHVRSRVLADHGVDLTPEVRVVGKNLPEAGAVGGDG